MSVSSKKTAPPAVTLAGEQHGALLRSLSRVLPSGLARRVLAAGDADRQRIERDLHDGVQQRLTGLRIRLALAAESFQERGDTDASAALNGFGEEVQQAIEEVRAFARGVYPLLLASEGLGAALVSASRCAASPIAVSGRGIRRCRPEVESAVYLTCLAAIDNAAKHAFRTPGRARPQTNNPPAIEPLRSPTSAASRHNPGPQARCRSRQRDHVGPSDLAPAHTRATRAWVSSWPTIDERKCAWVRSASHRAVRNAARVTPPRGMRLGVRARPLRALG